MREKKLAEMIVAQNNYIAFLEGYLKDISGFLHVHHMQASDDQVIKGNVLRDAIAQAKEEIFERGN